MHVHQSYLNLWERIVHHIGHVERERSFFTILGSSSQTYARNVHARMLRAAKKERNVCCCQRLKSLPLAHPSPWDLSSHKFTGWTLKPLASGLQFSVKFKNWMCWKKNIHFAVKKRVNSYNRLDICSLERKLKNDGESKGWPTCILPGFIISIFRDFQKGILNRKNLSEKNIMPDINTCIYLLWWSR